MDVRIESIRCCHVNAEGFTAHFTLEWSQMTAKLYSDAAISLWRRNNSVEAPSTKCTRCTQRCSEGKLLTPRVTHSWCCRYTRAYYPFQQPYRDFVLHMAYLHVFWLSDIVRAALKAWTQYKPRFKSQNACGILVQHQSLPAVVVIVWCTRDVWAYTIWHSNYSM